MFGLYNPAFKIHGFRYFGFFADYCSDQRKIHRAEKDNYFNRGGSFYKPETPKAKFDDFVKERKAMYNPFTVNPSLESRILKLLKSRPDLEIILIVTPSHKSAYGTEIQFEEMVSYLESLEAKFQHVRALAFDRRDYPDSHFKNTPPICYIKSIASAVTPLLTPATLPY